MNWGTRFVGVDSGEIPAARPGCMNWGSWFWPEGGRSSRHDDERAGRTCLGVWVASVGAGGRKQTYGEVR